MELKDTTKFVLILYKQGWLIFFRVRKYEFTYYVEYIKSRNLFNQFSFPDINLLDLQSSAIFDNIDNAEKVYKIFSDKDSKVENLFKKFIKE